jgi:AsmA protein
MKRRALIGLGIAALVAVVLGLRPWELAASTIENRVIAGIERATRSKVTSIGSATIAFLPTPHISLRDMKITQSDQAMSASVIRARAGIRLLALFSGQLDYDDIQLTSPQVDIAVNDTAANPAEWLAPAVDVIAATEGHGRITILDGAFNATRKSGAITAIVSKVNLVIARRKPQAPIELSGSVLWRGEMTSVDARWPVTDISAPASLIVRSPVLNWSFDGTREVTGAPVLAGRIRINTPSAKSALNWLQAGSPFGELLGSLKFVAEVRFAPGIGNLNQIVATVGNDTLEGALTIDTSGARWSLGGTLAGATLDLGAVLQRVDSTSFAITDDPAGGAFNLDALTNHNLDLRLSIETVKAGDAKLSDVAAQVLIRPGRLDLSMLQAAAYGGSAKGRLVMAQTTAGLDLRLQSGFDKVDLGRLSNDLPGVRRFSGIGYGQLLLEGAGPAPAELLSGLTGRLGLSSRNGDISGVAMPELLRRIERQPLSAFRDWRGGRSSYEIANLNATIAGGIVDISDSTVTGTGYKLTLAGKSSLANRQMALSGILSGGLNGLVKLPFEVTGPIFDPLVTPDTQVLIQRSGAAGPLLLR